MLMGGVNELVPDMVQSKSSVQVGSIGVTLNLDSF